ncbi:DUF4864 domain-containing protein [Coralliovum pocilloporae]|uniref:DUF4864 domain-containing protein n=1 Tax=Coralliovum pocilloporae TaxID=3066369 RepID=UPI0033070750
MFRSLKTLAKVTLVASALLMTTGATSYAIDAGMSIKQRTSLQSLTTADKQEIAFVVHSHIWAMTQRKAELAYQLATPSYRKPFATAPDYLKFLRKEHTPLAYAKSLTIDSISFTDGALIQHAYVTDVRKKTWRASFTLRHNDLDGSWRIDSFAMALAPGQTV